MICYASGATRVSPPLGKDWNETLLAQRFRELPAEQQWQRVNEGINEDVPALRTEQAARRLLQLGVTNITDAIGALRHDPEHQRIAAELGQEKAIQYSTLGFKSAARRLAIVEQTEQAEQSLNVDFQLELE